MTLRICLAGEGANELGGRSGEPTYWKTLTPERIELGVVEALLRKVRDEGWNIVEAIQWKQLRKLKARPSGAGRESDNVRKAALHASERGCDLLVFVRDRDDSDDHPNPDRETDIEAGIRIALEDHEGVLGIVGGVAIRRLESWLLAITGTGKTEESRRPEELLVMLGVREKHTAEMVGLVEQADLAQVPGDARSLRAWLDRARAALGGG